MSRFAEIEQRVGDYYAGKLAEHGPTAAGVDWNSPASQALRFEQLLRVVDQQPFSLLDWGCGYGALLDQLGEQGAGYVGYDVSAAMVASARELHPGARFETERDALPVCDYVVASGIFNVRAGADDAGWTDYVTATVSAMASLARRGVAFNALTSYSDRDRMEPRLHYADPLALFDWCKRTLSRNVALLHDYGLYEFTLLVRL